MPAYQTCKRISGEVGGTPLDLVLESYRQAVVKVYQTMDWSFQRGITYANWLAPGNVISQGTTTVTPYSNLVILDSAATQAANTYSTSPGAVFLTQLQYRDPSYSIYNIVGVQTSGMIAYSTVADPGSAQMPGVYQLPVLDNGGPGSGGIVQVTVLTDGTVSSTTSVVAPGNGYTNPYVTLAFGGTPGSLNIFQNLLLTLDRPWLEPSAGGGQTYMIYQAYFVAPVRYFSKFIEIRDTVNNNAIDFWSMTQAELAWRDPQRTSYANPLYCVAAGVDNRPGTSTPGWPMFELWPQQLSYQPYSYSYRSLGPVPESQVDFLSFVPPYPLSEELVEWRTREVLYQFREAQRDKSAARGSEANWLMLAQMARKEYDDVLSHIQSIDLNLNNEAFSRTSAPGTRPDGRPYGNRGGGVNIGGYGRGGY